MPHRWQTIPLRAFLSSWFKDCPDKTFHFSFTASPAENIVEFSIPAALRGIPGGAEGMHFAANGMHFALKGILSSSKGMHFNAQSM